MDLKSSLNIQKLISDLKDKFNLGPKDLIGVDIGQSAVKMAIVKKSGESNYKLLNYVSTSLPEACIIEDEIQKEDEIIKAIEEGLKVLKTDRLIGCIGICGPNTIARKLQLAGGSLDEIEDQVSWEAEQYLPFPIEDSTLSFHVFGENEGGGVDVLVAAAKNDVIERFKLLVEKAKLRVKIVDLNIIAAANVFEFVLADKIEAEPGTWVLLDMGAQKTQLTLHRKNAIAFTKEINIGGAMITEEIQRQMGVNYQEAEILKTQGDAKGNLPEEVLVIVNEVKENFFQELKKTIDFYVTSSSDDNFKGCVITGGNSLIPGIAEGLESLLGIPVSVLNPFEKIDYEKKLFSDEEINKVAFTGVVAIGLAMRELKK